MIDFCSLQSARTRPTFGSPVVHGHHRGVRRALGASWAPQFGIMGGDPPPDIDPTGLLSESDIYEDVSQIPSSETMCIRCLSTVEDVPPILA